MNWRAPVPLLALAALAAMASPGEAHRLDVQCFVRPGWQVQVESWYETGEPPRGARVEVFRLDGQLLTEGKIDKNGMFAFSLKDVETLRVVVTSVGHRAEATVTEDALRQNVASACAACLSLDPLLASSFVAVVPSRPQPTAVLSSPIEHPSTFPLWGAVSGVGILLGVAVAFKWLSMRRQLGNTSSNGTSH